MERLMADVSAAFAAGCVGGLVNSVTVWVFGRLGISAALGVKIAPAFTPSWLYVRIVWGGLWGLLFLLPWSAPLPLRAAVYSVGPTLVVFFVTYPRHLKKGLFGLELGALTPALVVTTFLLGWPSIIAVILNYVKRPEARGTVLESHFRWQIRTFWFAVPWALAGLVLWITVLLFPLAIVLWLGTGIWVVYRVIRGWLALLRGDPMPMPA